MNTIAANSPASEDEFSSSVRMQQGTRKQSNHTKSAVPTASWITPDLTWTAEPSVFCIEVPVNDSDLVDFIATGVFDCSPSQHAKSKKTAIAMSCLIGRNSLRGQVWEAVWDRFKLKPAISGKEAETKIFAHCHGVFALPNKTTLCVLIGRYPAIVPNLWISEPLKAEAVTLLAKHKEDIAALNEKERLRQENWDKLRAERPDLPKHIWHVPEMPPISTAERLLHLLPIAVTFDFSASSDADGITRQAVGAITASKWQPSRDGSYACILCGPAGRRGKAVVSWVPHTGLPSYPEVRWAVQNGLPLTLQNPRIDTSSKPELEGPAEVAPLVGFEPDSTDLKSVFDDLNLEDSDFRSRVDDIRKVSETEGFEAIAWFQPYHIWTEASWGIYFDARKLDDLALSLLDDFRRQRVQGSQSLAALLAFSLTFAHELFHAQVEAVLSWQELNSRQPRHLRYKRNVYDPLRQTPEWLEEALANWSAWDWFRSQKTLALLTTMTSDLNGLERVVEAALDLSPPGYREWRLGNENATWRTFANQLITGKPKVSSRRLLFPIESVIKGPLPFDLLQSDIPLRFVGKGNIADRLQNHPATFNVPGRRELERALRYFRYILDPSGGKGGHQKWTGPDQRAFTLPTRDPVSRIVFQAFLQHFGIDKTTYVRQIRPNI